VNAAIVMLALHAFGQWQFPSAKRSQAVIEYLNNGDESSSWVMQYKKNGD
jgi:hypothetical protein